MKSCIRIGFGKIARIHEEQLAKHGVVTIGVVETAPQRQREVLESGFQAYATLEAAASQNPNFYDVCVPVDSRLDVLTTLCSLDPHANILIEKPLCHIDDVIPIRALFEKHLGKISINENYASSNVTRSVRRTIESLDIIPTRIIIESTKHRGIDFLSGRYVDKQLGAIGYEGSHLLAIIKEFGPDYSFSEFLQSSIDSMIFSRSDRVLSQGHVLELLRCKGNIALHNQGSAHLQYLARNGCVVDLYTSMSGRIGFPFPPYASLQQTIPLEDSHSRYRMLSVEGTNADGAHIQIIGFYEPISNLARSLGQQVIFKDAVMQSFTEPFEDNTMLQHLLRIMAFFEGTQENPYSFESALTDVVLLNGWMGMMKKNV